MSLKSKRVKMSMYENLTNVYRYPILWVYVVDTGVHNKGQHSMTIQVCPYIKCLQYYTVRVWSG